MKQGKKIILRDWIEEDLATYAYWQTGEKNWMDYDAPYYPKLTTEKLQHRLIELKEQIKNKNWSSPRKKLVIANAKNNELIGTVSWYWQSEATNWKSIGIGIYNEAYWGKGIGYEALRLWIDYLFEISENLVRLDLRTWSGNQRMIQLAKKLGFKEEACFRKARIVNGAFYDSIGMGILKEEWYE
jgi:putative hydrolase of HD superfamily